MQGRTGQGDEFTTQNGMDQRRVLLLDASRSLTNEWVDQRRARDCVSTVADLSAVTRGRALRMVLAGGEMQSSVRCAESRRSD